MSCHDIGRGMNSVVDVAVDLYDCGEIIRSSAATIIHAARKGVHLEPYPDEKNFTETLATYRLCTECYDELVAKSTGDPATGPKARKEIVAKYDENVWRAQ